MPPPMQFRFEPDLDYQQAAIAAVCDLFRGQEAGRSAFPLAARPDESGRLGLAEGDLGVGNRLSLPADTLLANLREVQRRQGLRPADWLESPDFTVEMETGTGKTYVYLRTIFELHRQYGFAKFAIVVPSIAIKEGVNKSLAMMAEHFRALYAGVPFEHFLYDSAQLGQVRNFAVSPQLQIMVITVGAINKRDINSIYQANEKTGGEKPIDLVQATRPILIVDEPQSVEGGLAGQGRKALLDLNPLCTLRYSATPVNEYHMVYRLNAVDAYQRQLVKQIEVAAATTLDDYNRPYVRLLSVSRRRRNGITAQVEVDAAAAGGRVNRRALTVQDGDDLERKTGRALYADCRIGEIQAAGRGREYLLLRTPGAERWLAPGEVWGGADNQSLHRLMLREAIRQHLDKQLRLQPQGIKVLTLFFIDQVAKYRTSDADGQPAPGEYARIFEEEYRWLAAHPDYRQLFEGVDLAAAAEQVHNGYFSIDRRGGWTDTAENAESNQTNRDNAERAYRLIMRDKERLLSLDEPLQFIFSHSALREGWDNPNIFQICALRDIATEQGRRQSLGRGLRLCVNQQGERQQGFGLNTLTVIARESYEEFAENLQREMEQETGIKFGVVARDCFAAILATEGAAAGGVERSETLWQHLNIQGYIDGNGKIADSLRAALADGSLKLAAEFEPLRQAIIALLRQADRRIDLKKAEERCRVRPNPRTLDSPEFRDLWQRIRDKTTYRVGFDGAQLVESCAAALRDAPHLPPARLQWQIVTLDLGTDGVSSQIREEGPVPTLVGDKGDAPELPDLLAQLQDLTGLTRRAVCGILTASGRLGDFPTNPQRFIQLAAETINRCKGRELVDGIKYRRLGGEHYYAQELFRQEELVAYLKNTVPAAKSVYDRVVYDSERERDFAEGLERNRAVKVYAKLPGWFRVPTPLGSYNPDWAVLVEQEEGERLYLVAETKGSLNPDDLRPTEAAKIECGKAHFAALPVANPPAVYKVVANMEDLLI